MFDIVKTAVADTLWIVFSVFSAGFVSFRHLYVKKKCAEIPAPVLVFTTRLLGFLIMTPLAIARGGIGISAPGTFFGVVAVTALITAGATIVQMKIIQRDRLSGSVPYLSLIPLFMIPWTWLLLGEVPHAVAFIGIIAASIGAYILNVRNTAHPVRVFAEFMGHDSSRYMFFVAIALGLTTTCDKIAIQAADGFTYAWLWALISIPIMAAFSLRYPLSVIRSACVNRHVIVQSVLWAGAFLCQMVAIQYGKAIPSAVTYVKMLTLLNVLFTVMLSGHFFNEGHLLRSLIASLCMVGGAVVVVLSRLL